MSLVELWKLTMGYENSFANYIVNRAKKEYDNKGIGEYMGYIIYLSEMIQLFTTDPPDYNCNDFFKHDETANKILQLIFVWWAMFKK